MRILHWYPNFLHGGGIANAVLGLAGAQASLGHDVHVAAAEGPVRPMYETVPIETAAQVVRWQPARTLRLGGQYVRLAGGRELDRLRAIQPEIVHVHGEFLLDNLRVPRVFRCPLVISPHGACHPLVLRKSRRRAKVAFFALETMLLRHHIRMFHALSPVEAEHIAAVFPKVSTYCVPQGGSVLVPEPRASDLVSPPPGARPTSFLFVGRLDVYTKGLDVLLDAFRLVRQGAVDREVRLVVVGPDWKGGRSWLEDRARQLGIDDAVEFTGALTGSQVGRALAGSDVYVQLSRHEGFALSVAEALLARKPAILSRAIGTVTYAVIASAPFIRIVPPEAEAAAEAMLDMLDELPALTLAARRHHLAEFFSWPRIAGEHLDRYAELLRARPAPGSSPHPYPISPGGASVSSGL